MKMKIAIFISLISLISLICYFLKEEPISHKIDKVVIGQDYSSVKGLLGRHDSYFKHFDYQGEYFTWYQKELHLKVEASFPYLKLKEYTKSFCVEFLDNKVIKKEVLDYLPSWFYMDSEMNASKSAK